MSCRQPGRCNAYGLERQIPGLAELWARTLGDPGVCIAVLDGPVDLSHPCFSGADLEQVEGPASGGGGGQGAAVWHGTHLASLIFGQPGSPVRGLAPRCRGLAVPIYRERGDGSLVPCSQLDLARAIATALDRGANIINVSGGRHDPTGQPEPLLARALAQCAEQGVLVVAAAGNDGCACLHVPAAAQSVLVAGAMDAEGEPLEFSNWGAAYQTHGLLAPGDDISGAAPGGGSVVFSGTSVAAALVSGLAGLLASLQQQQTGRCDPLQVRAVLLGGATGCDELPTSNCQRLLAGRINIPKTLSLLSGEQPMAMNVPPENVAAAAPPNAPPVAERETPPEPGRVAAPPRPAAAAGCGCSNRPQFIYALGLIDIDFGSEAKHDFFVQRGVANPHDRSQLLAHLDRPNSEWDAVGLTWTLVKETTPMYVLQPAGPFARDVYKRLREMLQSQMLEGVSQVSIPGAQAGSARLMNGQELPMIVPDIRGMCSWSTPALVAAALGARPAEEAAATLYDQQAKEIANFLDRVYYGLSNLGLTSQDRALNYAATNAYQAATVYKEAIQLSLKFDRVEVERSAVCRPGSDCWDVKLTFFDPAKIKERAREVYQFTIDVSEIIPVTVGRTRHWSTY